MCAFVCVGVGGNISTFVCFHVPLSDVLCLNDSSPAHAPLGLSLIKSVTSVIVTSGEHFHTLCVKWNINNLYLLMKCLWQIRRASFNSFV